MAKKILYGLKNVYYAKVTSTGYATPVKLEGAVTIALNKVGDDNPFYADDVIYYTSHSNQGYEGDLELAMVTDAFYTDILGMATDSNGAIIETGTDEQTNFALGLEIQTNDKPRRIWFYNCTASRPNGNATTKQQTIAPDTQKINIKMQPRVTDEKVKVIMDKTATNESAFNSFFTAVYEAVASV